MEMDLAFKPGDVVQLNSGGPKMTVEAVQSDGTLRCVWFHEDGKRDNGVFAQVALPKRRIEDCLGNTFPKRTILDAHSAPVADLGAPPWWRQKAAVGPPTGLDQKSVAGRFKSHVTHQDRVVPGSRRGLLS
jgi:uncharacterized protein YodC (DUF2158 family)